MVAQDLGSPIAVPASAVQAAVDAWGERLVADPMLTSATIGVLNRGEITLSHFGTLESDGEAAPAADTLYEIASVTKAFTGMLLGQALVDGKLKLDTEVAPLLPGTYDNLQYAGEPIRVRHLVSHTAGLPFLMHSEDQALRDAGGSDLPTRLNAIAASYTKERFWKDLHDVRLSEPPGTRSAYSNTGTELAAYLLETVYGTEFRELMRAKVFTPGGFQDSTWNVATTELHRLAPGFGEHRARQPIALLKLWSAAAGLKSSPRDLMRLIRLQVEEPSPAARKALTPVYELDGRGTGCFWNFSRQPGGATHHFHHGGAFGAQNVVAFSPEDRFGVLVITNQSDRDTAGKLYPAVNGVLEALEGSR